MPRHVPLVGLVVFTLHLLSTPASGQPVRRFAEDSAWRRVWVVGAEKGSETFVEPRAVVASGNAVYVLDLGTRELRGFAQKDGAPRLVLTARGSGPGEFKRPVRLAAIPDGVAVLDEANARLTGFSVRGSPLWDVVVPDAPLVAGICAPDARRVIIAYRRADSAVAVLDTAGRALGRRGVRWDRPRPMPYAFAHDAMLSDASSSRGHCALVRRFGRQWATVSATGPDLVHPLLEGSDEPIIKTGPERVTKLSTKVQIERTETSDSKSIARAILVRGDTAIINGGETADSPHRLLDYYHLGTGAYLFSRRLPFLFVALAIGPDGTFYGAVIQESTQALLAFRPERLPTAARKAPVASTPSRDTRERRPPPAGAPRRENR